LPDYEIQSERVILQGTTLQVVPCLLRWIRITIERVFAMMAQVGGMEQAA